VSLRIISAKFVGQTNKKESGGKNVPPLFQDQNDQNQGFLALCYPGGIYALPL